MTEMRLFTVRVFDSEDEPLGEIRHVCAWNRREAYFSVAQLLREKYPSSITWDSYKESMTARQFYGPAVDWRSDSYPDGWGDRVPVKVRMLQRVRSDVPAILLQNRGERERLVAKEGETYYVYTNSHGAVSVWIGTERLGVKPGEFEVTEWMDV